MAEVKAKLDASKARSAAQSKELKELRDRLKQTESQLASQQAEAQLLRQEKDELQAVVASQDHAGSPAPAAAASDEAASPAPANKARRVRVARASQVVVKEAGDTTGDPGANEEKLLDALERLTALCAERQARIDALTVQLQQSQQQQQQQQRGLDLGTAGNLAHRPVSAARNSSVRRTASSAPLPPIAGTRGAPTLSEADYNPAYTGQATFITEATVPAEEIAKQHELKALLEAAETERQRLSEHNATLQRRLAAAASRTNTNNAHRPSGTFDHDGAVNGSSADLSSLRESLSLKDEEIALLKKVMHETRRVFSEAVSKIRAEQRKSAAMVVGSRNVSEL